MGKIKVGSKMVGNGMVSRTALDIAPSTDMLEEYKNLYSNVGEITNTLLNTFSENGKTLEELTNINDFDKYSELADKFSLSNKI